MQYQVIEIDLDKLRPSKFNPSKRTAIRNLGGLMASVERHGLPVPLVVTEAQEDGTHHIGDGHRRYACLVAMGKKTATCVIWPGLSAEEIWSILNAYQMSMTPAQWLEAVVCGLSIDQPEIPPKLRRDINELTRIVGTDTLWRIVDEGKSPSILGTAKYIGGKLGMVSDQETAQVIEWFLEFDAQSKARAVITGDYDLEVLRDAITTMRDFNFAIELD